MESFRQKLSRKLSHKIPGLRRKHIFDAELNLSELTAVPFVTGNFFCIVNVNEGSNFRGKTEESQVKRHSIHWEESYYFKCKLYSRKSDAVLDPCPCRITIIQEATGASPQKKMGHVTVDLAETAGSGDARQGLLIQQDGKRQRVGNSIFYLTLTMKIRSGDLIFRTSNVSKNAAERNAGRRSTQRESADAAADPFHGFQRLEMRPDMKPQGMVTACDTDETRAENAMNALHIRRNSMTAGSGRYGEIVNEHEKALRRFSHKMELLKHQQYIEEMLLNDSQVEDDQGAELHRRDSWKDIYSKRVQRQYRFAEKTKVMIGTRVSNFDTVRDVFQKVGILTDFSDFNKTQRPRSKSCLTASAASQQSKGQAKTVKSTKKPAVGYHGERAQGIATVRFGADGASKASLTTDEEPHFQGLEPRVPTASATIPRKTSDTTVDEFTPQAADVAATKSTTFRQAQEQRSAPDATAIVAKSEKSNRSIASIWAEESESESFSAPMRKSTPDQLSSPSVTSAEASERAVKKQEREYQKLMLRRRGLEERNEQRAENFMQKLRAMLHKGTKDKKKKRMKDSDGESITPGPGVDIFEESETEFSWTKRRLPVLQSRPHIMEGIVEVAEPRVLKPTSTKHSSSKIMARSSLQVDSKMDVNAAKDYYSSLREKEEMTLDGHMRNLPVAGMVEQEVNKYPFRDFEFRIAEEEAIRSDEDVSIRGRKQARKNKLVFNMIKEADAYMLRETIDNNRQKAILRNRKSQNIGAHKGSTDRSETSDSNGPSIESVSTSKSPI